MAIGMANEVPTTIAMFEDLENPPFGHWGTIVVWYS